VLTERRQTSLNILNTLDWYVLALKKLLAQLAFATLVLRCKLAFCPIHSPMKRTFTIPDFFLLSAIVRSRHWLPLAARRPRDCGRHCRTARHVNGNRGAVGLRSGALFGDQSEGQEQKRSEQQRQIDANQAELQQQRQDLEKLKKPVNTNPDQIKTAWIEKDYDE